MIIKNIKIHRGFIGIIVMSILAILAGCSSKREIIYADIDDYQTCLNAVEGADGFMPDIDVLDDYDTMELYCIETLGVTVSINLIVTYAEEDTYLAKKVALRDDYLFLDYPLSDGRRTIIEDIRFEYDHFTIRVVESEDFRYPAEFGMIGHSDTAYQIAYMFYSDASSISFDYNSMEAFVDSRFTFNNED